MNLINALASMLIATAVSLALAGDVDANGREVQREVVARVVSVDAERGTLVVERGLRGKVWRLTLAIKPATPIFDCAPEKASLASLKSGDPVSVYFEQMGREGLANLVVVEPKD